MTYVARWALAFAFTCAVEVPIVTALLARAEPARGRRIALAFYANLASHLAVWFVFPSLGLPWVPMVVVAEAWAVLSEVGFYRLVFAGAPLARVVAVALVANGASFGVGLLLTRLTGL